MEIGGNLTNDQQKIADNFSTYYKNIAMDLGNNIISGQDDHKEFLVGRHEPWSIMEVTREEVIIIIKSLKNKKVVALMDYLTKL